MFRIAALFILAAVLSFGVEAPARFSETNAPNVASDKAVDRWWTILNDAELNSLVGRAANSNLDLKLAGERLLEARAGRRIARAALLPSLDSVTSFDRTRGGFESGNIHVNNSPGSNVFISPFESNIFQTGFDASWELDFFGRRRNELKAATAETVEAEDSRRNVLVSLLGEVVRNYAELRGAQRRLEITRDNIALQSDSLHLTQVRAEAGLATQFDVERQNEQLRTSEALVPSIEAEIKAAVHAIGILLSQPPAALESELIAAGGLPANPPSVPIGLPADLLERRPDLRRARAAILAAGARVGAAKAELFPLISISGAAGRQATDLSGFTLGAGNFFSVGPSITLPIFEGGRIRANIEVRKQQLAEAQTEYESTVLQALREAEDALTSYAREQQRREKLTQAVASSREATRLATELYTRGLTDFLSVLDAQRDQLSNEDSLAQSDTTVLTDLAALYKSLGGGWNGVAGI